jgi:Heterokaryon incompatibility protein (HET)
MCRPPNRLVYVGPADGSENPRLVLTQGIEDSWVALSYCWGGESDFVLSQTTLKSLMDGMPLTLFPATIRDAITITRGLGVRYLWVDALCIRQDSQSDWLHESSKMQNVYKDATVTLIAASSTSVNEGIFLTRFFQNNPCPLPWGAPCNTDKASPTSRQLAYLRPTTSECDLGEPWPIHHRGWALQEDLLSSRTLSFSSSRIVWECATVRLDEGGRKIPPDEVFSRPFSETAFSEGISSLPKAEFPIDRLPLPEEEYVPLGQRDSRAKSSPYARWLAVVYEYTHRTLTKESDALPGLAGIASEIALETGYSVEIGKHD